MNGMNRVLMQEHIEKLPFYERYYLLCFHKDSPSFSPYEQEELEARTKKSLFWTNCEKIIKLCPCFFIC